MKIRKILSAYRAKLFGRKYRFEEKAILGRVLTIADGTIHAKTDKDDAWWFALVQRYDVIYDIGANVGYSSILACLNEAGKTIVLADPNPEALQLAQQHLEKNGMGANKTYINAFVGEKKGDSVKFYTLGSGSAGSMFGSHADSARAVNAYYMVPTTTLDDVVAKTGIVPQLVKIDVEAAESYVLNGANKLSENHHIIYMVEMHGPEEMPMEKNAGLILDLCRKTNYKAWYMKEHIELETAAQIAHRGRCHLLLMPHDMAYPEYLKGIAEGSSLPV